MSDEARKLAEECISEAGGVEMGPAAQREWLAAKFKPILAERDRLLECVICENESPRAPDPKSHPREILFCAHCYRDVIDQRDAALKRAEEAREIIESVQRGGAAVNNWNERARAWLEGHDESCASGA